MGQTAVYQQPALGYSSSGRADTGKTSSNLTGAFKKFVVYAFKKFVVYAGFLIDPASLAAASAASAGSVGIV